MILSPNSKLRCFGNREILRSTYLAIFYSDLNYAYIAWGLTRFPQQKVSFLQKSTKNCELCTF